jgi:hypothetical protein
MVASIAGDGQRRAGKDERHKPRILQGAHADWLRERIPNSDFTLRGLVAELAERGLKRPSNAIITILTDSSKITSPTSTTPKITAGVSGPLSDSRLRIRKSGLPSQNDSFSIRSIKCQDSNT